MNAPGCREDGESRQGVFSTTHWSLVLAAGQSSTPQSSAALEKLCGTYWHPLYVYVRRRGYNHEAAQDLTQEFFEQFLKKQAFERADSARGHFRTFLLTSLQNFMSDEWKQARRLKRGGGVSFISMNAQIAEDQYPIDIPDTLTPERIYEQRWAMSLLDKVLSAMREDYARAGKARLMDVLQEFVWGAEGSTAYTGVAAQFGMTEGAVRVAVHRLRRHYQERLRAEVAQTVSCPEEIDEELRYLISVLS